MIIPYDQTVRVARDHRINWVWYLWYRLNDDGSISILRHDRGHGYECQGVYPDPRHAMESGFRINESEGRIAESVTLWTDYYQSGRTYPVANPAHVFSYKG